MIRIEVVNTVVREVVKKATGEIFKIPEVSGYAHGIDRYPVAIKFGVVRGAQPPAPGMYELDPSSLYVGQFGALSIKGQLVLRPVVEPAAKRAA
jgi:hypothetical protein